MNYFDCSKALFYTSEERSVFLLRLSQTYRRETGPAILILSMDEELEITDSDRNTSIRTKSILVPAGAGFDFVTNRAKVAICFLNDMGTDFKYLVPYMKQSLVMDDASTFYCGVTFESDMINNAREVWKTQPSAAFTLSRISAWVQTFENLAQEQGVKHSVDPRVIQAVEIIRNTCTENIPVQEIAKRVGLSVPRLTQLFRETTATSIRSFRLWKRIFFAARSLQSGMSLTEAAVAAGFTDYAQCFRVYKDIGGYHPGKTKERTEVKVAA